VGELVLVDFDDVCVTNANRQLHAMRGTIGKKKVDVMAERLRAVNPMATITPVARFYDASSSEELLAGRIDHVVDAIDNMTAKAHLVATCLARGIPIVSSMGAAARLDPTRIRVADLAETRRDPFARALRKMLRKAHGLELPHGRPIGVPAVYSEEEPREPAALSYDAETGFVCVCPNKNNGMHTCERRSRIDGSASFVTGAFGLAAASVVVRRLTGLP
jgi:tRNA A37 threonylcarbamoyladenosine dehydratase